MRILVWTVGYYPSIGGIETTLRAMLHILRDRGYEIAVVAPHTSLTGPDYLQDGDIRVHRFHFRKALETGNMTLLLAERKRVAALKREFAPDLIHVMGVGAETIFHLQTENAAPAPYLVTLQVEESQALEAFGDNSSFAQILTSAAWVTSVSQTEVERIAALMPALAPRLSHIHNALPLPVLAPAPFPKTPILLCIGRMVPQKRFDLALRAFALVHTKFPTVRLWLAGDGGELEMLKTLAAELEIGDAVDFLGWVVPPEVPALINQATAVVLSSRTEGFPLVGVQTAQMARPLIAPRVGGIAELVVDGETGILTEFGDIDGLADAMLSVLTHPDRAAAMGRAARTRTLARYSFEDMVSGYQALYAKLVSAPRPPKTIGLTP